MGALTGQNQCCLNIKLGGTVGLTPHSPLIQNKNNHPLFYPLSFCYSVRKISLCSQHPHSYGTLGVTISRKSPGSHSEMALWAGSPGTGSSSRCRQEAPGWWLSDETERCVEPDKKSAQRKLPACPCRCPGTWEQFLGLI